MEPKDDDKQTLVFRYKQGKSASDLPTIPFHPEIAEVISIFGEIGDAALLAFLLKMVLKDRITDDEVQLICDVYYHD
ncbi:MAG TPA: hypothetical protein VF131_25775 [Blastocatellia bacterium]|nr:hypothetical protein [Blastocatellia bacterium]